MHRAAEQSLKWGHGTAQQMSGWLTFKDQKQPEIKQLWFINLQVQASLLQFDWLTLNVQRLDHIVVNELKVLVADPVLHISLPSCEEVVHHCHLMTVHHQLVSEMGSHKASPTSYLLKKSAVCVMQHLCKTQNKQSCTCEWMSGNI